MKRKELTKTCMMNSNRKNPLDSIAYTKILQRCEGNTIISFINTYEFGENSGIFGRQIGQWFLK